MEDLDLDAMIREQARSSGMSVNSRQVRRAAEKLRQQTGGHLDAMLTDMNPTLSPRERLRAQIAQARRGRTNAVARAAEYEDLRQKTERQAQQRAAAKAKAAAAYQAKLDQLEEQYGQVTIEQYLAALTAGQSSGTPAVRAELCPGNESRLLIDLYQRQSAGSLSMQSLPEYV
jgi:murein L,D-transpeptidase YcbB/YkuD